MKAVAEYKFDEALVTKPTFIVECSSCNKVVGISIANDFSPKSIQVALDALKPAEKMAASWAKRLPHDEKIPVSSTSDMCQCDFGEEDDED